MRLTSLRFAGLSDLGILAALLAEPESDMVERKRTADARTLAKVITAFANSHGGWLLLGVDDDGALPGWTAKGRAHPRDWLRDVLDSEVDTLPVFEADVFEVDGVSIGVVRVPRSARAPHWLKDDSCWERRNGQTARMSSHRIRELTLRDGGDREAAQARLDTAAPRDLRLALDAPQGTREAVELEVASIVRVSLLDPRESFVERVHDAEALSHSDAFLAAVSTKLNDRASDRVHGWSPATPTLGGHVGSTTWDGHRLSEAHLAWDKHGVGGLRLVGRRPDASGLYYLISSPVRDRWLHIALSYLLDFLRQADAYGPALVRWDLYGVREADVITTAAASNEIVIQGNIPAHHEDAVALEVTADVGVDSAKEVAAALWEQLERLAGARRHWQ